MEQELSNKRIQEKPSDTSFVYEALNKKENKFIPPSY